MCQPSWYLYSGCSDANDRFTGKSFYLQIRQQDTSRSHSDDFDWSLNTVAALLLFKDSSNKCNEFTRVQHAHIQSYTPSLILISTLWFSSLRLVEGSLTSLQQKPHGSRQCHKYNSAITTCISLYLTGTDGQAISDIDASSDRNGFFAPTVSYHDLAVARVIIIIGGYRHDTSGPTAQLL